MGAFPTDLSGLVGDNEIDPPAVPLPAGATVLDYADIGVVACETDHEVYACVGEYAPGVYCWSVIRTWNGETTRSVWENGTTGTTSREATLEMDFGPDAITKYVALRMHLGNEGVDSWTLQISGDPTTYYFNTTHDGTAQFLNVGAWNVGSLTGVHTLTITSTGAQSGGQTSWGQNEMSEVAVYGFGCTGDPDCDDGLWCNGAETCDAGVCQPGTAPDCSGLTDQCNTGVCNETNDACEASPANEGLTCDDGLYCNDGETCQSGNCTGGSARDCSSLDNQCNEGVCNEDADACEPSPINEGLACDDNDACNTGETCQTGSCTGGSAVNCSGTGDQCTADSTCDPLGDEGNCDTAGAPINEGLTCDDGLYCNDGETCQSGNCTGGSARDCSSLDNQCNEGVCNEDADACEPSPINEGLACDDNDACNTGETCQTGSCTGGSAVDCSGTGDQCTADSTCDPLGDEGNCDTAGAPINEGLTCDDGLYCNDGETCQSGNCTGGSARDCSSLDNQCNEGVCNEDADACEPSPINEGLACDDNDACNTGETCQTGSCTGGSAVDCSGTGDQCTADSTCDPLGDEGNCDTAGAPINEGLTCDDGLYCNDGETCQSGNCTGGSARDCSSLDNQCNEGVCNEDADACEPSPINEGLTCDDGLYCTDPDTCSNGVCGGSERNCADTDPCTIDTCDEDNDECVHTADIYIDVTVQLEGLGSDVSRLVTLIVTDCDGGAETLEVPMGFVGGIGSVTLTSADLTMDIADVDWIQATEGHTLSRLLEVNFNDPDYCDADTLFTADNRLLAGDFSHRWCSEASDNPGAPCDSNADCPNGVCVEWVGQDSLVDIQDFAILFIHWNEAVDPSISTWADVTGDGWQDTADFTAVQANFADVGDDEDGCPSFLGLSSVARPHARIAIADLPVPDAGLADRNGDGVFDGQDVRLFAKEHDLVLTHEFEVKLERLERATLKSAPGRMRP